MNTAFVQFNMSNNKYEVFYDEKRIAQSRNKAYFYNCFDKKKFKQYQGTLEKFINQVIENYQIDFEKQSKKIQENWQRNACDIDIILNMC